jgi:hypothetical protein
MTTFSHFMIYSTMKAALNTVVAKYAVELKIEGVIKTIVEVRDVLICSSPLTLSLVPPRTSRTSSIAALSEKASLSHYFATSKLNLFRKISLRTSRAPWQISSSMLDYILPIAP